MSYGLLIEFLLQEGGGVNKILSPPSNLCSAAVSPWEVKLLMSVIHPLPNKLIVNETLFQANTVKITGVHFPGYVTLLPLYGKNSAQV